MFLITGRLNLENFANGQIQTAVSTLLNAVIHNVVVQCCKFIADIQNVIST